MRKHELVREHIKRVQNRYREATRYQKGIILNELCQTWDLDRKYVIKLLCGNTPPKGGKKLGRQSKYDIRLEKHLLFIWNQMERISGKRMKAALAIWLPFYKAQDFTTDLRQQLLKMSPATLERWIQRAQKRFEKGKSTTTRPKFFRYKIPLFDGVTRDISYPGHVHADTVAHCGESLIGQFANTLTVTDRLSQWTENAALPNKEAKNMKLALIKVEERIPFRLRSFQNDCGTEFLNYTVVDYFERRPHPVSVVRSRPYHKNDNAHVEQKNFTHVREIFGYERYTGEELVNRMNSIYENLWNPLNNFFLPSMRLETKTRIGARIKKKYEKPKTPYQRLMECRHLDDISKARLKRTYESLNPFDLKRELERQLDEFFRLARRQKIEQTAA